MAKLYVKKKKEYLFSWEKIPGNDNQRLIEFLTQNFSIEWVKASKIEKNDNGRTIRVTSEKNYLSLKLNDEKTNVNLEIDDGRTDKFIVEMENGELNIYKKGKAYIREKSKESAENLDAVHENKVATWEAFGSAAHDSFGRSMEDVIQSVSDKMKGKVFKKDKPKVPVTEKEYQDLLIQAIKKGDSEKELNMLVEVVAEKKREPTVIIEIDVPDFRICHVCEHLNDPAAICCIKCGTLLKSS